MALEVNFSLIRDRESLDIVGLSFEAEAQYQAEVFCAHLPRALADETAELDIEDDGNFQLRIPGDGTLKVDIGTENVQEVITLLTDKSINLGMFREGMFTPGLRINRVDADAENLLRERMNGFSKGDISSVLPHIPVDPEE